MKSNKGRYQNEEKRKKKVSNRKYMSYEDVPLEDYRDEDPMPNNITKRFLKMFFILFLAVVTVMVILNIEKLTPDNIVHWFQYDLLGKTDGEGYPVNFSGSTVDDGNFDLISGVPAYCSDTTITVLNKNAGVYQENQHSYASPTLSVNDSYGIVYNTDATGYTIFKRDSIEYTGAVKNKIFAADISANGTYAILTKGEDYVSARNGGLISVIYILDFSQDNFLQRYEMDDTFIHDVKFLDNGNAYAVGTDKLFFINIHDGTKKDIPFGARYLTAYAFHRGQGVMLALSANPDGRSCDLLSFDINGEQDCEIPTGVKAVSLSMRDNDRAILSADKITVYDRDGNVKGTVNADTDARKIIYCDKNTFYVLGKSRISRLSIEN